MEEIKHRMVSVNGITMHIAEKGQGPVILFLHGFPELWYSFRHQILALSALGYHTVAPDLRGYGDTESPASVDSYTCLHIVGDLVSLIHLLQVDKVLLVAHDWGAIIGWYLCLFLPEKVKAFVCLSVPFWSRNPDMKPLERMRAVFGDDYYICRFQEAGRIEAEIDEYTSREVLKKILTDRKPGPARLPKENPFGINPEAPMELPSWLSEDDLNYYVAKFEHKGFAGGLNYYRALDLNWELTGAWTNVQVKVPVKYVVGEFDMVYTTPGMKEYVHNGGFKRDVPLLEEAAVIQGAGHFIQQERPQQVNNLIRDFFANF